jgi:hypothetical protein
LIFGQPGATSAAVSLSTQRRCRLGPIEYGQDCAIHCACSRVRRLACELGGPASAALSRSMQFRQRLGPRLLGHVLSNQARCSGENCCAKADAHNAKLTTANNALGPKPFRRSTSAAARTTIPRRIKLNRDRNIEAPNLKSEQDTRLWLPAHTPQIAGLAVWVRVWVKHTALEEMPVPQAFPASKRRKARQRGLARGIASHRNLKCTQNCTQIGFLTVFLD